MGNPSGGQVIVPLGYPTSLIYVDESGSRASASNFFVIAALKVRQQGKLARAVLNVRERNQFFGEFKFSAITRGALPAYYDLVDCLEDSELRIAACVADRRVFDPFRGKQPVWRVHAEVTTQLLVGCINKRELVTALLDVISVPTGSSLEDTVRQRVNRRLGSTVVVSAACLDSKSSDGLQLADLIAGAIAFERRRTTGESGNPNSSKAKVAKRLCAALGSDLTDGKGRRVNIATYNPSSSQTIVDLRTKTSSKKTSIR